jgi:pumilio family protein 6
VSSAYPSGDESAPHAIDLPHTSRLYKTLLQGGHFNHASKEVEAAPLWDAPAFAATFVERVGEDVITSMATKGPKNGAFVVGELCGALVRGESAATDARNLVKAWFTKALVKKIEDSDAKGKTVLVSRISEL